MSRRHRAGAVIAVVVTAPLAAGVAYAARPEPNSSATPAVEISMGTATVTRGTLTQSFQVNGTLAYTGSYTVGYHGASGVLTAVSAPGTTIGRGGILYRVSDAPVRLLLGAVPVYRDFTAGMSDGPDVRQLEVNLAAMGFDPHHRMTVDRHFTAATAAAIRRWEASWGRKSYQRTGRLTQGQIVFLPAPLRVTALQGQIGAAMAPGTPVLTATSTSRAVIAQLDATDRGSVRVGDQVQISLPNTDPIPGRVAAIGQTASASSTGSDNNGPSQPQPADPDTATVQVTITVRLPRGFDLDQAPATVDVTTATRSDVLLVPIAALLARPGGGYQVRLAGGRPAPVEPGRFDESSGQVEIVHGLTEGQPVEVPAS